MSLDINQPRKNITRFTYQFTSFLGWRVSLCRQKICFIRYFSDKQYGSPEESLRAAIEVLERVKENLLLYPDDPGYAFKLCQSIERQNDYPAGMRPRRNTKPIPPSVQGKEAAQADGEKFTPST